MGTTMGRMSWRTWRYRHHALVESFLIGMIIMLVVVGGWAGVEVKRLTDRIESIEAERVLDQQESMAAYSDLSNWCERQAFHNP